MFGQEDLKQLRLQKQALVLESSLNRHALILEIDELRSTAARVSNALEASRRFVPFLTLLAPVAGFFAVRSVRQPGSIISRLAKLAKWAGPAYTLWRSFSAARSKDAAAPLQ
jgi:hypothetical protein